MVNKTMHTIYVLRSLKDDNLYIGCTSDLQKRLREHRNKKVFSTRNRLPMKLIYFENYPDKYEAYRMERFYKTAKGKKIIKNKII
ncbi:MAG: GIY-YIG nuclease family protein [Patescibacteria group bacterium]|nr:GIY-YIG nuclease family protein [Patescibacteria group bacterium]MDD5164737.1 GIY-YIG nuclease family protein [Patescibacteria group bacterium]MDD5534570.1 GIY-YIG nuclease family protein [Patescibacteria group bacterium]